MSDNQHRPSSVSRLASASVPIMAVCVQGPQGPRPQAGLQSQAKYGADGIDSGPPSSNLWISAGEHHHHCPMQSSGSVQGRCVSEGLVPLVPKLKWLHIVQRRWLLATTAATGQC